MIVIRPPRAIDHSLAGQLDLTALAPFAKDPDHFQKVLAEFTERRDEAQRIIQQAATAAADLNKREQEFAEKQEAVEDELAEKATALEQREAALAQAQAKLADDQQQLADDRGAVTAREEEVRKREVAVAEQVQRIRDAVAVIG
jgi:hypothetical protein